MGDIDYRKDYLPGYTGHVPKKNEIYGCTAGDINRILTTQGYKPSNHDVDFNKTNLDQLTATRTFYSRAPNQEQRAQTL